MHIGSKGGHNDPLVAVFELPIQAFRHDVLTGSKARALHIGGVAQQGKHTLVAQLAQTSHVQHAVFGGGVDLKVAGHYHRAYRRVDGESHSICDGVIHMNKLHGEAAGLYHIAGLVGDQTNLVSNAMLFQFQLHKTAGHSGCVNRAAYLLHAVGDRTNVVLVTVGNKHTPNFLCILGQIGKVGDHQIHAVHIFIGKTDTAIYDNHILSVL